jgi:hypothetical protein
MNFERHFVRNPVVAEMLHHLRALIAETETAA